VPRFARSTRSAIRGQATKCKGGISSPVPELLRVRRRPCERSVDEHLGVLYFGVQLDFTGIPTAVIWAAQIGRASRAEAGQEAYLTMAGGLLRRANMLCRCQYAPYRHDGARDTRRPEVEL
jgi:hypothetical protein